MQTGINLILISIFWGQTVLGYTDKPCAARQGNGSYVCVCNSTYCDDFTRETPVCGKYYAYTTSQSGFRFTKSSALLQTIDKTPYGKTFPTLNMNPGKLYQRIEGFGGAVTDSAGINYSDLTDEKLKAFLIESYFGPRGIEYNMMRVPIGGCDFSTHAYAYNEYPVNDTQLTNFSLSYEDYKYKIPMIKDAMKVATAPLHLVASTWSPPPWMKDPSKISGVNRLRNEYFQTYALYHLKFFQCYKQHGIDFWAVTTTNEPLSGIMSLGHNNRLGWTTKGMGNWIVNNLSPTLRNANLNIKILAGDDQRFTIPMWFNVVIGEVPEAINHIDGVAVHFYFDKINPPDVMSMAMKDHPEKFLIYTESCNGAGEDGGFVNLGSWFRATNYFDNILEDLNYNVTGWIDWNICLDKNGGPNYISNFVDSPIIVFPDVGEFVKQPTFYAMGHFSKFIPRGSRRIHVNEINCSPKFKYVSVVTPQNNIVTVLHNDQEVPRIIKLRLGAKEGVVTLVPNSFVTVEFPISDK